MSVFLTYTFLSIYHALIFNQERNIQKSDLIDRATETFDHLFWEAIAQVCQQAISKAFELKNKGEVRVVYETGLDPRQKFEEIKRRTKLFISQGLPIKKIVPGKGFMADIEQSSSRPEYLDFFLKNHKKGFPWQMLEIGKPEICCFCEGQHLRNTGELNNFFFKIEEPKKIGKNTFEFRFRIF